MQLLEFDASHPLGQAHGGVRVVHVTFSATGDTPLHLVARQRFDQRRAEVAKALLDCESEREPAE